MCDDDDDDYFVKCMLCGIIYYMNIFLFLEMNDVPPIYYFISFQNKNIRERIRRGGADKKKTSTTILLYIYIYILFYIYIFHPFFLWIHTTT